jgi:integrase
MKVKYKVIYNRKNKTNLDGTAPIEISCYLRDNPTKTKRYYYSTGIYIRPKQWSKVHNEINKHHNNQEDLNDRVKSNLSELEKFELKKAKQEGGYFQLSFFSQFRDQKKPLLSLIEFIDDYIENDNSVKLSTKKQYKNLLKMLDGFRSGDIKIKEINLSFVKNFDNYLFSQKYSINNVWKHHKNLKKFLNHAINLDLYPKEMYPYDKFKPKREKTERVFLTESELKEFEGIKVNKDAGFIFWVKKIFLFECYTGIRYSDIKNIRRIDFDVNGKELILKLKSQKTGKFDRIPLNDLFGGKAVRILNNVWREDDEPFFGGYSLQYVNRELKELIKLSNIKKNVTTHVGRHTFGTTMSEKVPMSILKKLMQHSDLKTTEVYIHTTDGVTKKTLSEVDWKVD